MPLTPEEQAEFEERFQALEDRNAKLERLLRSGRAFTDNPLSLATDLDDLGSVKTYLEFEEALAPVTPRADTALLYGKVEDGSTTPFWRSETGDSYSLAPRYRARVTRDATQTMVKSTLDKVEWDTEDYDPLSDFDIVTARNYAVPVTGRYLVTAHVSISIATAGVSVVAGAFVDGADVLRGSRCEAHSAGTYTSVIADILALTAGEVVDIRIFHDDGTNRDLTDGAKGNSFALHCLSIGGGGS